MKQDFVDAHVHLWDLDRLRYSWLSPPFSDDGPNGNVSAIASTYRLGDYQAEASAWNVVGMVHVEAGADPAQALDESDWLQAMADAEGLPSGIVAFAPLDHPGIEAMLAAQAARPIVRGIRQIVSWHADPNRSYTPRDVTGDAAWQRGFGLLARHGLSFDLQAYPGQFETLAGLIERHPETQVILNHAGSGIGEAAEWRAAMAKLARLPNVAVKISGLGFVWNPLDPPAVRDRVRETIDLFGTDRAMFASDFPTDRLFGGFDETLGLYAEAVADLTPNERQALFAGNANRIYRLGLSLAAESR